MRVRTKALLLIGAASMLVSATAFADGRGGSWGSGWSHDWNGWFGGGNTNFGDNNDCDWFDWNDCEPKDDCDYSWEDCDWKPNDGPDCNPCPPEQCVPEPASMAALAGGGLALLVRRRRKK